MSQGMFRLFRTTDDGILKRAKTAAFGLAGASVSAKQGRLYKVTFVNKSATKYFAQIHNKASAPVATDVPVWEDVLPANGSVTVFFDEGLFATLGLGFGISTTAGVLTMAAADDAIAYVHYTVQP